MKHITTSFLTLSLFIPILAFAETPTQTNVNTSVPPAVTSTPVAVHPAMSCIVKAYDVRESSVITAFDSFNSSVKIALAARKEAMITALSATDKNKRKDLRKHALSSFENTMKIARLNLKNARLASQDVFKKEAAVCGKKEEGTLDGFKEQSSLPSVK